MSVKYNVNKDAKYLNGRPVNGVIKARLDNTSYDVANLIGKMAPIVPTDVSRYMLKDMYFAKTGCSLSDTYDEERGKEIAKKKMMVKYDRDKIDALNLAIYDLENVLSYLKHQLAVSENRIARNSEFLEYI